MKRFIHNIYNAEQKTGFVPVNIFRHLILSIIICISSCSDMIMDYGGLSGDIIPKGGIAINEGREITSTYAVTVTASVVNAVEMSWMYPGDTWDVWTTFQSSRNFILAPGTGTKTIHARFRDMEGDILECYDSIYFVERIAPTEASAMDDFSRALAVSADGTVIAGGTPSYDVSANSYSIDEGKVFVYTWDGSEWNETRMETTDGAAGDLTGYSIDMSSDGSKLVAGAIGRDSGKGSICVFSRSASGWDMARPTVTLTEGARLGISVAISSDGSLVAAGADHASVTDGVGQVYMFSTDSTGLGTVTSFSGSAGDRFGRSCDLSGDGTVLVVGVPGAGVGDRIEAGAVDVFRKQGGTWNRFRLTDEGMVSYACMGTSVAVSADGSLIASGAPYDGPGAYMNRGTVVMFRWNGSAYQKTGADLAIMDAVNNDCFGSGVTLSRDGSCLLAGAPGRDGGSGSVYLFQPEVGEFTCKTILSAARYGDSGDNYGSSMGLADDLSLAAVGAPRDTVEGTACGALYVERDLFNPDRGR